MKINTHILSTAALDDGLLEVAFKKGVEINAVPFIQLDQIKDEKLTEELEQLCKQELTVVFTSANAVNTIGAVLAKGKPHWSVYCIGHATRDAVLEYLDGSLIKGVANNGEILAGIVHSHSVSGVVFFCGDKRLDALPDKLNKEGIMVREVVVYKTKETPERVLNHYQGVMFFSPNGVNSFFSVNEVDPHTVLFAIGNTTAKAVQAKTNNKVVVSDVPSREELVHKVIQYFHKEVPVAGK